MYTEYAIINCEASAKGNYKRANKNLEILISIIKELKTRGLEAQCSLLTLLKHNNFNVRLWAATHVLEFAPQEGEKTLTELAGMDGLIGIEAKTTLKEWKLGRLRRPRGT